MSNFKLSHFLYCLIGQCFPRAKFLSKYDKLYDGTTQMHPRMDSIDNNETVKGLNKWL